MIERREKEELREGDVAGSELFAKTQDEAPLHLKNDVRKPLRVGPELVA